MDQSIEFTLIDSLFKLIFENQGIICGSPIREYILPLKDNKKCPAELYIWVNYMESFYKTIQSSLKFCFDIKTENYHKNMIMQLKYKFQTNITFIIHIYQKNFPIPNMFIDVNNFTMTHPENYIIPTDISIIDIANKINTKIFKVLKTFKIPKGNRRQLGIVESSTNLLCFIETMYHTTLMLENYWTLDGQYIEEIFEPCLIKKTEHNDNCDICDEQFNKYELELNCCKKVICFKCAINQVKTRFDNSEINCPFCRGDLFGWKTNKLMSEKTHVNDFDDIPPLESHTDDGYIMEHVRMTDLNAPITSSMLQSFHHIGRYNNDDEDMPELESVSENNDTEQTHRNDLDHRFYTRMLYGQLGVPDQTIGRDFRNVSRTSLGIQRVREILNLVHEPYNSVNDIQSSSNNHNNDNNEMEMVD